MRQPIIQVDAFTDEPFRGNPAAICIVEEDADEGWMQALALEMNLSETAYLVRKDDGYGLRWFTPTTEVDLCGHATVAAAHVLWEDGHVAPDETCRFHTRSGLLTANRRDGWIEVKFPREDFKEVESPAGLSEALGVTPSKVVESRMSYCLLEVDSEETVRGLQPDIAALKAIPYQGIIVTGASPGSEFDFVSRFFAPRLGVDEDPVTGSAHCVLGPYWQTRTGKSTFNAFQASPRGGIVRVRVEDDCVRLGGQAVTVMRGALV